MGCCVSTKKHHPSSKLNHHSSPSSRAPPPVDVETVKEVLSETPNLNSFKKPEDDPKTYSSRQNSFKFRPDDHTLEDPNISEIGSTMSENISTTTFDDDDNDVYRRKVVNKSPVKSRNRSQASGELQPVRKSPVRGAEQSPGRVKLVHERYGRETGFGSSCRRSPGSGNVSAARSRSPAKRTAVGGGGGGGSRDEIGRSLSGRRTGKSPGRVGSDLHESVRKPEIRSGRESKRYTSVANKEESLENPFVSLECFIFL